MFDENFLFFAKFTKFSNFFTLNFRISYFAFFASERKANNAKFFFAERFPFFAGDPRHHLHCTTNTFVLAVLRHHALSLNFLSIVGNPVSMYLYHL